MQPQKAINMPVLGCAGHVRNKHIEKCTYAVHMCMYGISTYLGQTICSGYVHISILPKRRTYVHTEKYILNTYMYVWNMYIFGSYSMYWICPYFYFIETQNVCTYR